VFSARPELMARVVELATLEIMRRSVGVAESMVGMDGEVWGDLPLRGGPFMAYYADLEERGVLGALRVVSPRYAERLDRQFEREVSGLLGVVGS
jgi:hypothetical protein